MFDVVALGESLIDFTQDGRNDAGALLYARNPGGAPANVLAMNPKLGGKTAFIGMDGRDEFGQYLRRSMEQSGIDCRGLCLAEHTPTTLAFVQLNDRGDRSFLFYRNPGADTELTSRAGRRR
jgi:fructokinase